LKYFVRLAAIGTAYAPFVGHLRCMNFEPIVYCRSLSVWAILQGKVTSGSVR
jgi:hypothetical protein